MPSVPSIDDIASARVHGDCQVLLKRTCAPPSPGGAARACIPATMSDNADNAASPSQGRARTRVEVRSVTGACYTLIEEADRDGTHERVDRRYRTAYAGLPVIANDDGSFTLVDTQTRLVQVSVR